MDQIVKDFRVNCNNCYLDSICLPRGLAEQDVESLIDVVKTNIVIQKGEYIYHQGDKFDCIVAIKSGTAKLVANDGHGNEHIINILLPGELTGFDGLFQNYYNCSVIALEVISYCKLPSKQLNKLCIQVPNIALELFKHSSENIKESQDHIVSCKFSAEEKLAIFLTNLSDRLKQRGFSSLKFNLPLTRKEMGDYLGLTLETVSRMLQKFQNEGLISIQRKCIEIHDLQALRNIFSTA